MPLKLAVSNIAWPSGSDDEAFAVLRGRGVDGLEVAPTKVWPRPAEVSEGDALAYRASVEGRGLRIVSAQALLFGRPELVIFGDEPTRRATLEYLDAIVRLCSWLGAEALVFGSPGNRLVGGLDRAEADRIAVEFFGELAGSAERHGTAVVLEANPPEYGADFVTRAGEAVDLVRLVDRPGLRLHLDSACMTMAGDDVEAIVRDHSSLLHHVHASEPQLAPIGEGGVDHGRFAEALRRSGYGRWVSIEMRAPEPYSAGALDAAIAGARESYAGVGDGRRGGPNMPERDATRRTEQA